jgi:hypothetical protein
MFPEATIFSSPHNGERAFQAGDYDKAVNELLPLARSGNATARYYIARMFQEGKGLPGDKKAAFSWAQIGHGCPEGFREDVHVVLPKPPATTISATPICATPSLPWA